MHVLLTGASSGIGEALAFAFAQAGYDLTLVARRADHLERVSKQISQAHGRRTHCAPFDLTDLDGLAPLVEAARQALGPVDVLVNNAGVQIVGPTHEIAVEDAERLMTLNVLAPFRLTRLVLPEMVERHSGTVVDVSSLAAIAPTPGMYHYSASKAALAAASEAHRAEAKRHGIHVVTVYPGPVKTDLSDAGLAAYEGAQVANALPVGRADVLARRIVRAVGRRRKRVIYPRFYALARAFPILTRWLMDVFSPIPKRGGSA